MITEREINPATGRLTALQSGPANAPASVQNLKYRWDALGNLVQRRHLNPNRTETYGYDALNRLTTVMHNNARITRIDYNALGNITRKTGVGRYSYGNGPNAGPHAVTAVTTYPGLGFGGGQYCKSMLDCGDTKRGPTPTAGSYHYDANGNMVSGAGRTITWSAANYPVKINQGGAVTTFTYGPAQQRYRQSVSSADGTKTTLTIGALYQKVIHQGTGVIAYKHHIRAAGQTIAIVTRHSNAAPTVHYLHRDHLGSIVAVTDKNGEVIARMRYSAFGARRATSGSGDASNPLPELNRGYTGHQMLDEVNLIHMNGRIYAPEIGRFLSADPHIPHPYNAQSFNRYTYVMNNPLSLTDPSGFIDKDPDVQQACGPDLDCDGELTTGEQRMAEDICSWHAIAGCKTLTDGDGLFWTTPASEVQNILERQYIDRIMTHIDAAMDNFDQQLEFDGGNGFELENTFYIGSTSVGLSGFYVDFKRSSLLSGGFWKGRNGQWYPMRWGGNGATGGRTRVVRAASRWKVAGTSLFYVGVGFSVYGAAAGKISPAKAALDIVMGAVGAYGGPPGAAVSAGYFLIDVTVGWGSALRTQADLTQATQEILDDPGWSPYGSGPF